MERTNSGLILLVVFVVLALYLVPFYPEGRTRYELTDWATAASLVESNSFELSSIKKQAEVELEGVIDKGEEGVYSSKAPGIAFLAVPVYALTRVVVGAPDKGNVKISWNVLRLVLGALPLLMLAGWLYSKDVDSYSLAALVFASPLLAYSLLLYSHVIAAILVYMGFRMIYDFRRVDPETCFSASFLFGVATICEYSAIVPALVIGIGLIFTDSRERFRRVVFFTAGILPPIALLLVQQFFVFGSPLAFLEFTGLSYPNLTEIYTFLISPSNGLFFFSPLLVFGLFTFASPDSAGRNRFRVKVAVIVVTFLAVCGAAAKFSGESAGPRYLILIVPFLLDAFFDGEIEEYPSFWRGFMFAVSMGLSTIPLLSYPFAPAALSFPHNSFWVPLIAEKGFYPVTAAQFYGYGQNYWTAAPVAALLLIALFLVWRDAKRRVPFGAGLLIGLGAIAIYVFAVSLEDSSEAIGQAIGKF